jgi:hypothetical protein
MIHFWLIYVKEKKITLSKAQLINPSIANKAKCLACRNRYNALARESKKLYFKNELHVSKHPRLISG